MDPERLIGQAKNKISSLGNKIPEKKYSSKNSGTLFFWAND